MFLIFTPRFPPEGVMIPLMFCMLTSKTWVRLKKEMVNLWFSELTFCTILNIVFYFVFLLCGHLLYYIINIFRNLWKLFLWRTWLLWINALSSWYVIHVSKSAMCCFCMMAAFKSCVLMFSLPWMIWVSPCYFGGLWRRQNICGAMWLGL